MASLIVVDRSGNERDVAAKSGQTVMEVIHDAGFDELLNNSSHRGGDSRLACQIGFVEKLDDLRVTIAEED